MTLMNDKIAQDLKERGNISLGSSLDGPEFINDKQRYFVSNRGMYQKVVHWVKTLKQEYGLPVNVMPVLTVNHIGYERELIDQYLELDLSGIYLKYVSVQGPHERAYSLKFAPDQYVDFWKKGLEYILEINKNGRFFMEGETMVMLQNVLLDTQDFMCLQRPCGAGTSMLTVDQNRDIFLCDLGRSIDLMKFGNVMTHTYDEVITSESARMLRGIASETLPKCNSNARTTILEATKTDSLTKMLKSDGLKMLEALEPIHDTLTEMLQQQPRNPNLAILLGEAYRAMGNSQQAMKLHDQMGFILNRDWLIIGPWVTRSDYRGLTAFNEVLPPEKRIELNEEYKTVSKTSRKQWLEREIHWIYPDFDIVQSYVDLRSVLKTSTMACYALSYAKLPVPVKAQMRLGVSGALKVWVNDKLVYLNPKQKYGLRVDEYIVPVAL